MLLPLGLLHPFCVQLCELQFAAWRSTLWSDIKTSDMEDGTKGFVKEVKGLSKKVGFGDLCVWPGFMLPGPLCKLR